MLALDIVSVHTNFMITVAEASVTSTAAPEAFFGRWADMATWPEWNADTEWVRLDGPFVAGATGTLKPKGGPKVGFTVTELDDRTFVDESRLWGARLTFAHRVGNDAAGRTTVRVLVTMRGPLARLWMALLGKGIRESAQRDLEALAGVAERAPVA